jgi:hypothetical protein
VQRGQYPHAETQILNLEDLLFRQDYMPYIRRSSLLVYFISPYGLATISCFTFAIAWLFPPEMYTQLVEEPDLLFLNIESALFYAACVAGFLLGLYLVEAYLPAERLVDRQLEPGISPMAFILGPLCVALLLNMLSLISVLRQGILLPLLLSGEGGEAKDLWQADGSLVLTSTCLAGVMWWAIWRSLQLQSKSISRLLTRALIYVAILVVVLSASLMLNRIVLFSTVIGSVVITLSRRIVAGTITGKAVLKTGLLLCALMTAFFVLYSSLRGNDTPNAVTSDLVQYTISSYNRLPALLSGALRYPYAGTGVYLISFLESNNLFNRIIPVREMLKWPSYADLFKSEFWAVWRANLNGKLIWSGTFGYVCSELGWLSPGYLFFYGLLYGCVWRSLRRGLTFGIVLYPWFAFCILFWLGTNELLDTMCAVLVIDASALAAYEWLLMRRVASVRLPTALGRRAIQI